MVDSKRRCNEMDNSETPEKQPLSPFVRAYLPEMKRRLEEQQRWVEASKQVTRHYGQSEPRPGFGFEDNNPYGTPYERARRAERNLERLEAMKKERIRY